MTRVSGAPPKSLKATYPRTLSGQRAHLMPAGLNKIARLINRSQQKPVIVCIHGEANAGKNHLAYKIRDRLAAEGKTCLISQGERSPREMRLFVSEQFDRFDVIVFLLNGDRDRREAEVLAKLDAPASSIPETTLKEFGYREYIHVGIFNPRLKQELRGTYDVAIENCDSDPRKKVSFANPYTR